MLEHLERLQFSIPISVAIEAPIDVVWAAVKDIQSYPTTYSSVEKVRPNEDRYCSNVRSSATSGAASSSNGDRRSSGDIDGKQRCRQRDDIVRVGGRDMVQLFGVLM